MRATSTLKPSANVVMASVGWMVEAGPPSGKFPASLTNTHDVSRVTRRYSAMTSGFDR